MNIAPSLLQRAAAEAAGAQQYPAALYVVATPIGNLADLTLDGGVEACHDCSDAVVALSPKMGDTAPDAGHREEQPEEVLGAARLR